MEITRVVFLPTRSESLPHGASSIREAIDDKATRNPVWVIEIPLMVKNKGRVYSKIDQIRPKNKKGID